MRRAYAKRGGGDKPTPSGRRARTPVPGREVRLPLDRDELLALMQDSLEGLIASTDCVIRQGKRIASSY